MCECLDCHLIFRLGLAYAGSNREDVLSLLLPVMGDSKSSMEVWMHLLFLGILLTYVTFSNIHMLVCLIYRWSE